MRKELFWEGPLEEKEAPWLLHFISVTEQPTPNRDEEEENK